MKQEIRFRGLNLAGDEYSAQPGELSLCAGVELHDGALRPSLLSGSMIASGSKLKGYLLYVHKTQSYTHYITASDAEDDLNMYFAYVNGNGSLVSKVLVSYSKFDYDDIRSIESIGNTLVIMTNTGLHYFLYKSADNAYKYLGNSMPFLRLQFRPSTNYQGTYDRSTVDGDNHTPLVDDAWRAMTFDAGDACTVSTSARQVGIKADKQGEVTDAVWAIINQTNNYIAKEGHFYAPFMVRYCYRLYDGSMVMHSAPVFMNVSLPLCYKVYSPNVHSNANYAGSGDLFYIDDEIGIIDPGGNDFHVSRFTARYTPNNVSIQYRMVPDASELNELKEWGDIVKSVDIFITPPITREDSSEKIQRMIIEDNQYGCRGDYLMTWVSNWSQQGREWVRTNVIFDIPMLSDDAYVQKIRDTAAFYKIKSFSLTDDSFSTSWKELDYDKSVIPYITTQEQMTDDYKTHNILRPVGTGGGMYAYNHRLNVFGMQERLFEGFNIVDMINPAIDYAGYSHGIFVWAVVIELDTEDGKKYVISYPGTTISEFFLINSCLFYPDSRAVRMAINTGNSWRVLKMEPCPMLNGSMAVTPFLDLYFTSSEESTFNFTIDTFAPLLNKIYTSEVNNPFYFPVEGINTVGVGTIRGLAATTRALSQGQFGQYPLMAFCTDGIWALNVSSTGTYSSVHPISREVCVNPESICQLDQSVMFATDRALSRVVESTVASCSDMLDGPMVECGTVLPRLRDLFVTPEGAEQDARYEDDSIAALLAFDTPPIDYFRQGRLLYDFTNSRVLVLPRSLPKDKPFPVYVFSVRDLAWSTMLLQPMLAAVNSYPYPYVQQADGSLMVLDKLYSYADNTYYPGIIVTRPLSYASVMQALQAYQQVNNCEAHQLLILYGSNDLRQWHYIGRSQRSHAAYLPAHAFRYFRIALYLQMHPREKYSSLIIDIIEKYRKL